jgi:AcrR family transcriptional regulator
MLDVQPDDRAVGEVEVRRGRPRNESCTGEILHAALHLVAEEGMAGFTMDAVAARAGVGKATIYRRWSSKEALMLEAWTTCMLPPEVPDTGNLEADLLTLLRGKDRVLSDSDLQRVYPQMIAAAKVNPEVGEAYSTFVRERRAPLLTVLRKAVERGEIDPTADLDIVHDLLLAPLLYRWLITDAPVDEAVVVRIIATVTRGVAPA